MYKAKNKKVTIYRKIAIRRLRLGERYTRWYSTVIQRWRGLSSNVPPISSTDEFLV